MPDQLPDHETIRDLLGAYALGAVDADERSQVESHLPSCASCSRELAGYGVAVAGLAKVEAELGAEDAALLTDVGGSDHSGRPPSPVGHSSPSRRRLMVALGVAALLLVVASVSAYAFLTQRRLSRVEKRLAHAEQIELVVARSSEAGTRTAHLTTATAGISVDVIVLADGNGLVWKSRLPKPSPQHWDFLWAQVQGQLVPIGPLDPNGKPEAVHVPTSANGLVATEERTTGPPVGTRLVVSGSLSGGP